MPWVVTTPFWIGSKSNADICDALNIQESVVYLFQESAVLTFPVFMNTYGFHGIHGRASAISTGVKVANPTLTVWQITGDGDALAIGGNHFIHAIRRNIDINIILFNNQIYGLTKGQYSPTSKLGMVTKTSPFGTVEHPFNPGALVLGARGTFFARSLDVELKLTQDIMLASAKQRDSRNRRSCKLRYLMTRLTLQYQTRRTGLTEPLS